MFWRKPKFTIVEIDRGTTIPVDGGKEAAKTLSHHPGYLYLLQRLRLQRGMLETQLKRNYNSDHQVDTWLKAGIFWAEFFEREAKQEANIPSGETPRLAVDDEIAAFKELRAALTEVGIK